MRSLRVMHPLLARLVGSIVLSVMIFLGCLQGDSFFSKEVTAGMNAPESWLLVSGEAGLLEKTEVPDRNPKSQIIQSLSCLEWRNGLRRFWFCF